MTKPIRRTTKKPARSRSLKRVVSPLAHTSMWCGRTYLKVADLTLAVEGDICRCCNIADRVWTKGNLAKAAREINKQANAGAQRPAGSAASTEKII